MKQNLMINVATVVTNDASSAAQQTFSNRALLTRRIFFGALFGLLWAAALRLWMTGLAIQFGGKPEFSVRGTVFAILLPATIMGAILGAAAHFAENSRGKGWRWSVLSPLLLALIPVVVLDGFIGRLIATGLGSGAIYVSVIGFFGGYALSGFSWRWTRILSGALCLFIVFAPIFLAFFARKFTLTFGVTFLMLAYFMFLALLCLGVSAPSRYAPKTSGVFSAETLSAQEATLVSV